MSNIRFVSAKLGGDIMLDTLIHNFIHCKKENPSNANELLDFLQKEYVHGAISIVDYRNIFRKLTIRGAVKPV
jgi:hypothetical protein